MAQFLTFENRCSFRFLNAFFLFFLGLTTLLAQKSVAPSHLNASYQKYANRIELTWQAHAPNQRFRIFRTEGTKGRTVLLDSVRQNRYVDRIRLKSGVGYSYQVRSVAPDGALSDASNRAVGALLIVANGHDSSSLSLAPRSLLKDCLTAQITEGVARPDFFAVKFAVQYDKDCSPEKMVHIKLFRSDNDTLDVADQFLSEQTFELIRTRGALTTKNNGEPLTGYFLLKIEKGEESVLVTQKIVGDKQ